MSNFKHEFLSDRLIRIIEVGGVSCYLVIGDDRACLLDTGCGYGNLKEYVETLTNKPVFVILTHAHLDHMGASALFDEVYMNHKDNIIFKEQGQLDERIAEARRFEDTKYFTIEDLVPTRTDEIKNIEDDQVFDLGNMHIKMIPVYGHTPGMMCPLIVEERAIIFGDACGVSTLIFDDFHSLTISEYRDSLLNLKKYENEYDHIYRNHGNFWSPKELLDNVIECCELILKHEDDHCPIQFRHYHLFAAKNTSWATGRLDGKTGNILYTPDRAK